MPTLRTLTGDLDDFLGGNNVPGAQVYVEHNLPDGDALIDTTNDKIRLGKRSQVSMTGNSSSFSVQLFDTNATDLNVAAGTLQYQIVVEYPTERDRETWRSGWFHLTANHDLTDADLLKSVTPVVAETGAEIIAIMESLRDESQAIRDDQALISGLTGEDSAVAALLNSGASNVYAAISAGFMRGHIATHPRWGCDPSGVADSYTGANALLQHVATNGGTAYFPTGTYKMSNRLQVNSAAKPFSIEGAGIGATKFVRAAAYAQVLSLNESNNIRVGNFSIDGGQVEFPTNASHGVAAYKCNDALFHHIKVTNYKNSGIIAYTDPGVVTKNVNIVFCHTIGNGSGITGNGILLSFMTYSFIRHCVAENTMGGSPGTGLQLKNDCDGCGIVDGLSINCDGGYSFSQDVAGVGPRRCKGVSLTAIGCKTGMILGGGYNNQVIGLTVDMENNAVSTFGLRIQSDTTDMIVSGLQVINATASSTPLQVEGLNAVVAVDLIEDETTSGSSVIFGSTSARNVVRIKRLVRGGTEQTELTGNVTYNNTLTNSVVLESGHNATRYTIASDAITISNRQARVVILDTEAAAATDDLVTINGGLEGQEIVVRTRQNAQDVTVRQTGNIRLSGSDMVLDNRQDTLRLIYNTDASAWCEVSRSNNGT